ncbi:MAG: hypothetical protein O3C40_30555 [Planctomycetota bacterium]|nr:hypothetical protein [Planctomycetota bacterium]
MKSPAGEKRIVPLLKRESEDTMEVERDALLAIPMECFAVPTDLATGEFVEPGNRVREKAETVKLILKLSGKVIDGLSDRAEFMQDFVDRVPCLHPETGMEVAFKEYLRHYVTTNGYVEDGYFTGSDLDKDPVGVFLRLLLFDKWVLYEAKLIHGPDGGWYSMEDCFKGRFKSPYSHLALESLKNALKFQGEAKDYPAIRLVSKTKAYTGSIASYINTCLYIVEANRDHLLKTKVTTACYERIRGAALKTHVVVHYRTPLKIAIVD